VRSRVAADLGVLQAQSRVKSEAAMELHTFFDALSVLLVSASLGLVGWTLLSHL
jgi:hypothetical protein